jgi:hypothetical protein
MITIYATLGENFKITIENDQKQVSKTHHVQGKMEFIGF